MINAPRCGATVCRYHYSMAALATFIVNFTWMLARNLGLTNQIYCHTNSSYNVQTTREVRPQHYPISVFLMWQRSYGIRQPTAKSEPQSRLSDTSDERKPPLNFCYTPSDTYIVLACRENPFT